jgi:hypothetical protein
MTKVAILDEGGLLVGTKTVTSASDSQIDVGEDCDLPTDGTYRWNNERKCFHPIGYGHGKPARPPVSDTQAFYLMMKAVSNLADLPDECKQWMIWYEENLLVRQQERLVALRKRKKG